MTTVRATHPLGWGTVTSHPWDDCVEASEAEGYALDARVLALADVGAPSAAVEREIRTLAQAIDGAATRESSGGQYADMVLRWRARQIQQLQAHATRLGYRAQDLELR